LIVSPQDNSIGQPYNIQHNIHVELDNDGVGFKGLPAEWQDLLLSKHDRRTMKIVERPDSLFNDDRKSVLKANVLKAVQAIQEQGLYAY
jgi:hypothetical protein